MQVLAVHSNVPLVSIMAAYCLLPFFDFILSVCVTVHLQMCVCAVCKCRCSYRSVGAIAYGQESPGWISLYKLVTIFFFYIQKHHFFKEKLIGQ